MTFASLFGCASVAPGDGPSRCEAEGASLTCDHEVAAVSDGAVDRDVLWQVPLGDPPDGGWPVAVFFQGSLVTADSIWAASAGEPFGGLHQVEVTRALLDGGFAVVAPEAAGEGLTCWDTNVPPWAEDWAGAPDDVLMRGLLAGIADGRFGPLDADALFALGISSGGYMTSRMAVSYPGRFRRLVVVSGSYATCAGAACVLPDALPADHPPTRFLHGALDVVVPVGTMRAYADRLVADGVETDVVVDANAGHAWIAAAPDEVLDWLTR